MKRAFFLILFLFPVLALAQTTTVTLQVTDGDGQTWNNGTWSASLVMAAGQQQASGFYLSGTTTVVPNQNQAGDLSSTGAASMNLTPNGSISPAGSIWTFTVCPAATSPCFTQQVTIAGSSQTVTLAPPGIRISMLNPPPRVAAYGDEELSNALPGHFYYNLLTQQLRTCAAAPCFTPPSTSNWTVLGGGTGGIALSATALDFNSVVVGSTASLSVTAKNNGILAITFSSISGSDTTNYTEGDNCTGSALAVNASCTITVTFQPQSAGTFNATLSLTDSAAGSPQTVALTGTGTATAPTLSSVSVSPASSTVNVGANQQETATETFSDGSTQTMSTGLWVSSNASDATVSSTGVVNGVAAGSVSIYATPALARQSNTVTATSAQTLHVPVMQPQLAGDTNIIFLAWSAASGTVSSITDLCGNTYSQIRSDPGNGYTQAAWIASGILPCSSNNLTITLSASQSTVDARIIEYPGLASVSPVDASATATGTTATSCTGSVTTTNADDLLVGACVSSTGISAAGTGYTNQALSANGYNAEDGFVFTTGAKTVNATMASGTFLETIVALKAITGSASVTVSSPSTSVWMSPTGSDSNNGATQSAPVLTWTRAAALEKAAGAGTAIILINGTYNSSNSGFANLNCASGGNFASGNSGSHVVIQAATFGQAKIAGDGTAEPMAINNCSYIDLKGLYIKNGDFSTEPDCQQNSGASNLYLNNDTNILVYNNVFSNDNRYCNAMLSFDWQSTNITYQQNEFYYFHRHAIDSSFGSGNEYLMNYFNSRNYADINGGRASEACCQDRGDSAISLYPAQNAVAIDNISEGNEDLYNIEATQSSGSCPQTGGTGNLANGNSFWGGISYNDNYGAILQHSRGSVAADGPADTNYEDIVSIVNEQRGAVASYIRSPVSANAASGGTTVNRMSLFGNGLTGSSGYPTAENYGSDQDPCNTGGGTYLLNVKNSLSVNAKIAYGFSINTSAGSWSGTFDHNNAYGNGVNFSVGGSMTNTNSTTTNPALGSCYVYIPSTSPMYGAGASGSNIGAGMLYEHNVDGSVGSTKLWNTAKNPPLFLGCGPTVSGLNDSSGNSCFDVSNRVNVGTNGCSLPTNY